MDTRLFYRKRQGRSYIPPESSDEDCLDSDDSDLDKTYVPERLTGSQSGDSSSSEENCDEPDEVGVPCVSNTEQIVEPEVGDNLPQAQSPSRCNVPKLNLLWKRNTVKSVFPSPVWTGEIPPSTEVFSPLTYFKKIFDSSIIDYICQQTNLYSKQCDVANTFSVTSTEIEQFIGIAFYMSLIAIPGNRRYWNKKCGVKQVSDVMTLRRWEQIKRYLHFADNTQQHSAPDRLFKVRMVSDMLRKNLSKIPIEEHLAVDEQIVPFKGHSSLKQYNPKKPKKWGYKIYCIAGASGIIYDFEVYSGPVNQPSHLPNVNASGNVVLRLAERIPKYKNHKLFYDNWFCSPELQVELVKCGIHSLGTVQLNRVRNNKMPSDAEMKKQGRGTSVESTASVSGYDLILVKWQDNRCVSLLGTFSGTHPESQVARYDKKTKQRIQIKCPKIVKEYNKFMGGVDTIDSLLALYRTKIRSKKYYMRLFFHLLDMSCVVAWLLYKRACHEDSIEEKTQMALFDFKLDIAESLCWSGKPSKRQSLDSSPGSGTKKRRQPNTANADIRKDRIDHWPNYCEKSARCKYNKCQKITKIMCTKCNTYLCFVPDRNCFYNFHNV
ncbi:piggyBac transposable element-derived protein 3-like [Schistocerca piceifrons]|uniref:piggyBac transposable element-derived protein 3-like n=1 Tax=Schistocerca piceifrons TaxID=274613 RepID=UPI001F5F8E33|nr:piggyBac transposable element-derived protein 3-like [Schistocerca piceifrons]XP_047121415.1 piggyBac transposable element-derived protein 3-like [Schistocerca piceifrons]